MKTLKGLLFVFLFICIHQVLLSAPPPPPAGGGTPVCWPPPCIPVDGGVSILIAAGAAYGAKKIYSARKKSNIS